MDTAEKIGLLPGFGWLAGHSFWETLALCVLVTPVGHLVVGLLLMGRFVPISPKKQFLSFFPGDLFLAVVAAGLLTLAQNLPEEQRWYNHPVFHVIVLISMVAFATKFAYGEWKAGVYPTRAVLSPTNMYHTYVLIGLYGYVVVVTGAAVLWAARSWWLLTLLIPLTVWLVFLKMDNSLPKEEQEYKARHAHVADWEFPLVTLVKKALGR